MIPRRVGILGGMGPEATVLLMQRVIRAVPAADDAAHVPLIVDQNPQVPSRIGRLIEGTGDDPAPVLAAMARRLEGAGAEALAMPCNTAHHYAGAIRGAVGIPFLDMVALSARRAAALIAGPGRVGILGSPALRRIALFEAPLAAHGLTPLYPRDEGAILAAMRAIKAGGPAPGPRAALAAAAEDLAMRGAMLHLVACTEFSLIVDALADRAGTLDTLDVLVEGILDFALRRGSQRQAPTERPSETTGRLTGG